MDRYRNGYTGADLKSDVSAEMWAWGFESSSVRYSHNL